MARMNEWYVFYTGCVPLSVIKHDRPTTLWVLLWNHVFNFFQHDVCVNSTLQNAGSGVVRYTESSQSSPGIIYKYNGMFLLWITPGHMLPKCINGFSMATKWHIYFEWGWKLNKKFSSYSLMHWNYWHFIWLHQSNNTCTYITKDNVIGKNMWHIS